MSESLYDDIMPCCKPRSLCAVVNLHYGQHVDCDRDVPYICTLSENLGEVPTGTGQRRTVEHPCQIVRPAVPSSPEIVMSVEFIYAAQIKYHAAVNCSVLTDGPFACTYR